MIFFLKNEELLACRRSQSSEGVDEKCKCPPGAIMGSTRAPEMGQLGPERCRAGFAEDMVLDRGLRGELRFCLLLFLPKSMSNFSN